MSLSAYLRRMRQKVGTDLLMSVGVAALIRDDQGRVLLGQRADTRLWSVPGGSIDPHEAPADAVVREVWEETGLWVEPRRVLAVYGGPDLRVTYPNGDQVSSVVIVFDCRALGGDRRADGDEMLALATVPPEEVRRWPLPAPVRDRYPELLQDRQDARFDPPTWQPPADGLRQGGISAYMRGLRQKVGTDLILVAGTGAIIFDEAGRVLLQQRGDTGRWGIIGGAMEPDETPADAVVREVWEETGLLTEPTRITGVYGGPEYHVTYPNGDQIAVVSIMFECRVLGGELRADGQESLALAYFPPPVVLDDPDIPPRMRTRLRHAVEQRAGLRPPGACFAPPRWAP